LLPKSRLDEIAPYGRPLTGLTENSVPDRLALEVELDQIRQQGYATNMRESDDEIAAVGVAIRDPGGRPSFGIAVAAPASRMTSERVHQVAAAARATALDIERNLNLQVRR
jgi:DNA-binding IclR family transcriptional regulator